jgi:hypothetical protein
MQRCVKPRFQATSSSKSKHQIVSYPDRGWGRGVIYPLKKIFKKKIVFYVNLSEFGGPVCGCTFVILRIGVPGVMYPSKKFLFRYFNFFFNVNLSDHNKGKRHAIPFTVELIMNSQFDWIEVLYAQNNRLRKSNLS